MKYGWILLVLGLAGCTAPPKPCTMPSASHPAGWSSEKFYLQYSAPGGARDAAVVKEMLNGNFPEKLRAFSLVSVNVGSGPSALNLQFTTSPDYLTIGSEADSVRTPLSGVAAQVVASHLGMALPTPQMVDWIYQAADVRLEAQPTDWYKDQWRMRYGPNYLLFDRMIEKQLAGRSGLIAGQKKDVVISNLLDQASDRVVIYGWFDRSGRVIQPVSTAHNNWYEDYSHGARLIGPWIKITDVAGAAKMLSIVEALRDPKIGNYLNGGDGPLRDVRAARSCSMDFLSVSGLKAENCPPQPATCN